VITTFENDDYVYQALRAGASGFLLKRARPQEIVQALRTVALSDSLLSPPRSAAWRPGTRAAGRPTVCARRGSPSERGRF
jgi:DNA-binding NarL/FixJ family response regulator